MKAIKADNILITGSTDRSLIVWDLETLTMRYQLVGHVSTIRCLEVWRDYAISGSRDGTLRIWNWRTGDLVHHIHAHTSSVRCLALFGEGFLVSGSYDHTCALWNIKTGCLVNRFEGHSDKIYAVASANNRIYSGSMDGTVKLWRPDDPQCYRTICGHRSLVGNLKVYDRLVVSASTDGAIKVWDTTRKTTVLNLPSAHPTSITTIDMNRWALITGSEGFCRLWDPITGHLLADYSSAGTGMVWRVAIGEVTAAVAYRLDGITYVDFFEYSTIN